MSEAPDLSIFAEALYDLLKERALSWGLMDIAVDVNERFIDGELMFSKGPDMGFSVDTTTGVCKYCELVGSQQEDWLPVKRSEVVTSHAEGSDALREQVLAVMDGVLEARRPLLKR